MAKPYQSDEYYYLTGTVTNVRDERRYWFRHRKLYVVFEMDRQEYRIKWNWRLPPYKEVVEQMRLDDGPYTIAVVKNNALRSTLLPDSHKAVIDVRTPTNIYVDIATLSQNRSSQRTAVFIAALIFVVPLLIAQCLCGVYLINDYAVWGKGKLAQYLRRRKKR